MKLLIKHLFLFLFGGTTYCFIEILWRNYTHPSMFVLGGVCFIICGLLNEIYTWDMALTSQMVISSAMITLMEFLTGILVNVVLKLDIWDYSLMPYNLLGQICLLYTCLWFWLSLLAIVVDDYVRYKFFKQEKPYYKIF